MCIMQSSCSRQIAKDEPTGYLLGWDPKGIAIIDISSGRTENLIPQPPGLIIYKIPIYDKNTKALFFVDERNKTINEWSDKDDKPKQLCSYPKERQIHWLLIDPYRRRLLFAPGPEYGSGWENVFSLMAYDFKTSSLIKLVDLDKTIDVTKPFHWLNENKLLVQVSSQWATLNIKTWQLKKLPDAPSGSDLLPNGKTVLCYEIEDKYLIRDLQTGKTLRSVCNDNMPGGIDGSFTCPINENYAAIGRRKGRGPFCWLRVYLLNLQTGKDRELTQRMLYNMTYLDTYPK